jgi:hypothetical protein
MQLAEIQKLWKNERYLPIRPSIPDHESQTKHRYTASRRRI